MRSFIPGLAEEAPLVRQVPEADDNEFPSGHPPLRGRRDLTDGGRVSEIQGPAGASSFPAIRRRSDMFTGAFLSLSVVIGFDLPLFQDCFRARGVFATVKTEVNDETRPDDGRREAMKVDSRRRKFFRQYRGDSRFVVSLHAERLEAARHVEAQG